MATVSSEWLCFVLEGGSNLTGLFGVACIMGGPCTVSRFHQSTDLLLSPKAGVNLRDDLCLNHPLHIQDQLFGLIATAMRYVDILCDETDMIERLDIPLRSIF